MFAVRPMDVVAKARIVVGIIVLSILGSGLGMTSAVAAEESPAIVEWSTTYTAEETVTVTETATVDGYTGSGTATATASATATGSAQAATWWEVNYYANLDAYEKATAAARAQADSVARPIAKERAQSDAQAKADAGPVMIQWSTTYTAEETVTVTETATVDGYTASGTATATASATATGSAEAATWWEVNYYANLDAYEKATAAARAKADAEARPVAKQRAQALAEAGPVLIDWSTSYTAEETVTVTETATIDGFTGYGTATATATATATGTASETTYWEVYYWATTRAVAEARSEAKSQADAEARAIAKQRAEADAQAQADAAADEPDPSDGPSCGAEVLKEDGTAWTCTFVDNFAGSELDAASWTAVETANTRFGEHECFVGLGDNVQVHDGTLRLTAQREPEPFTCIDPDGDHETEYTGGSITSLNKFSQTYGRFEIRAAMPETDGPGLHSALWLVPDEPAYYGGWPNSGEIDIVEYYSANPDRLIPALHYNALAPFNERTNNECLVFRPTDFHTYAVEWTAARLKVTIDGTTCVDHAINPLAPLTGSAPFDRPFNINLTQGLGLGGNTLPEGATVDHATMQIDYVRVWS